MPFADAISVYGKTLPCETAVSYITGMQEQGVMSTIKHFAVNTRVCPSLRKFHDSTRDLSETFRKAVKQAQVGAIMTSYNPINGTHAANIRNLSGVIPTNGASGIVSDWVSTYSPIGSATSGLDLEMRETMLL